MNNDNKFIKELMCKIFALAKNGVGGEKENAKSLLKKLLKKNNMTIEELEENDSLLDNYYSVKYPKKYEKLAYQIIASVIISDAKNQDGFTFKRYSSTNIHVFCNKFESLEINAKVDFYIKRFIHDSDIFYSAFIDRNDLYTKRNSNKKLTAKEREDAKAMLMLSRNLNKHEFNKQIGVGGAPK